MLGLSLQTGAGVVWREVAGAPEVIHFITASSASSTTQLPVTQHTNLGGKHQLSLLTLLVNIKTHTNLKVTTTTQQN